MKPGYDMKTGDILDKKVFVTSFDPVKQTQQYIGVDEQSGGYWFWSDYFTLAANINKINPVKIEANLMSQRYLAQGRDIYVIEVESVVSSVRSISGLKEMIKKEKLEDLRRQKAALEKRIAEEEGS